MIAIRFRCRTPAAHRSPAGTVGAARVSKRAACPFIMLSISHVSARSVTVGALLGIARIPEVLHK